MPPTAPSVHYKKMGALPDHLCCCKRDHLPRALLTVPTKLATAGMPIATDRRKLRALSER